MAVKKIIQFGICAANTDGELAAFVNRQLKEGWELHGFVFTSIQHEHLFFHQAMVSHKPLPVIKKVSNVPKRKTHSTR